MAKNKILKETFKKIVMHKFISHKSRISLWKSTKGP